MEIAAALERTEVFKLLKEGTPACKKRKFFIKFISYQGWGSNQFINLAGGRPEVEITDKVKLIQMSLLMKSNRPKTSKNEFQSRLGEKWFLETSKIFALTRWAAQMLLQVVNMTTIYDMNMNMNINICSTEPFCKMPSTREKLILPDCCWNLGEFGPFFQSFSYSTDFCILVKCQG